MDSTQQPTPQQQPNKMTSRTKLALWLMIGPTALAVVTFILFATINLISASLTSGSTSFGETTPLQTVANILLFLTGGISFLTWLPGLIIGIVLLATKPQTNA
jgi:hypothetical protein